ncbi:Potassium Voltage-Gated Channel Subfamily A Member 3 [Manis pentadactyla]|nr:Potassium Voltage-Gated Channel Subfamily A Member 3 [Manis pentadactyla]
MAPLCPLPFPRVKEGSAFNPGLTPMAEGLCAPRHHRAALAASRRVPPARAGRRPARPGHDRFQRDSRGRMWLIPEHPRDSGTPRGLWMTLGPHGPGLSNGLVELGLGKAITDLLGTETNTTAFGLVVLDCQSWSMSGDILEPGCHHEHMSSYFLGCYIHSTQNGDAAAPRRGERAAEAAASALPGAASLGALARRTGRRRTAAQPRLQGRALPTRSSSSGKKLRTKPVSSQLVGVR